VYGGESAPIRRVVRNVVPSFLGRRVASRKHVSPSGCPTLRTWNDIRAPFAEAAEGGHRATTVQDHRTKTLSFTLDELEQGRVIRAIDEVEPAFNLSAR